MDAGYGGGILYGVTAKHVKIDRPDVGRIDSIYEVAEYGISIGHRIGY